MANADGGETPNTNEAQNGEPQYLTAKDAEALFSKIANAAITGHLKRQPDVGKLLDERLAKFAESFQQQRQPDADGAANEQPTTQQRVDPELVRMRQRQEQLEKSLAAEKKAREDAEQARRTQLAMSELQGALTKFVRPEAVATLVKAFRGDIGWDGDEAVLPVEGGTAKIADAIDLWAKSKDAALYLPAPSQGGGGTPRPNGRASTDWQAKPQSQWNESDSAAALADFVRRNAAAGG